MGLGDVTLKVVPKMTLIAPPRAGGHLSTRTFIPHKCHAAIGVLGAVSVATAASLPGSIATGVASSLPGSVKRISVEHPSGEFTVEIEIDESGAGLNVVRSSLVRTARTIMTGHVFVPRHVWSGQT